MYEVSPAVDAGENLFIQIDYTNASGLGPDQADQSDRRPPRPMNQKERRIK
jgi:hypothetical protein